MDKELSLEMYCKLLPKLELHAHLNGSLSNQTLKQLHEMTNKQPGTNGDCWKQWETIMSHGKSHSLEECFQMFNIAHSVTSSPVAIRKATQDVIQEFALDGVVYLELRSTPREVSNVMSKLEYIEAIAEAILESTGNGIIVKLLVSLDRRHGREIAEETLNLVLQSKAHYPNIIVGLDLSGDPTKGNVTDFLPILEEARRLGLKIAIHCAEIPHEPEVMKVLQFRPDRLGHGTCIHPSLGGSETLWQMFLESQIPVELCLTSNVRCKTVNTYEDHHFKHIYKSTHPLVLATDDKGVFNTNLSDEYQLAAENFNLSKQELWNLSAASIDYTFATQDEKSQLKYLLRKWKTDLKAQ